MSYAYISTTGTLIVKSPNTRARDILDAFEDAYLRAKAEGATEDLAKMIGDDAAEHAERVLQGGGR